MQLNSFLKNILDEPQQAIKLMVHLIDNLHVNEKNEQAILEFFHSLPLKLTADKKIYEYPFFAFFQQYKINENNVSYYNEYIHENFMKLDIIEKNPQWKFEQVVFNYNTLKDLIMNFQTASYKGEEFADKDNAGLQFIEDNIASFKKFSKASPKKFTQALIKKKVFEFIQAVDYQEYKKFCETCSLNYLDILKEMYIKPYSDVYEGYGFRGFISHTKYRNLTATELESILSDVKEHRLELFGQTNQFFNFKDNYFTHNREHISMVFMEWIAKEKYDLAITLLNYFKPEIVQGLNTIPYDKKNNEDIDLSLLINVKESLSNYGKQHGSFHEFTRLETKQLNNFLKIYQETPKIKSSI